MAECNLETITVTDINDYPNLNGVYTKESANNYVNPSGARLLWSDYPDGGPLGIIPLNAPGQQGPGWYFMTGGESVLPVYFAAQDPADCPLGLNFTFDNEFSFNLPEGIVPSPTFGLPADVVALITARHGSVANFLRLRNQGQI